MPRRVGERMPSGDRSTRLPGPARLEAFSDAVFAIVLTILVLDLLPGDEARSPAELLAAWPAYVAYLAAFLTVGSIWLTHHDVFSRVARVDAATLVLNLGLLLGTSLVPWPTALISVAVAEGERDTEVAAFAVYGLVSVLVSVAIFTTTRHLARRPDLLRARSEDVWMRRFSRRALASLPVGVIGAAVALVSPVAALVLFLLVPITFVVVTLIDGGPAAYGD